MGDDNLALCPTCKHKVSKSAVQCPNCGERFRETKVRVKTSRLTWFIGALIFIPMIWGLVIGSNTKTSENMATSITSKTETKTEQDNSDLEKTTWNYKFRDDNGQLRVSEITANSLSFLSGNSNATKKSELFLLIYGNHAKLGNKISFGILNKSPLDETHTEQDEYIVYDCNKNCFLDISFDNGSFNRYPAHKLSSGSEIILLLNADIVPTYLEKLRKSKIMTVRSSFIEKNTGEKSVRDYSFSIIGYKY